MIGAQTHDYTYQTDNTAILARMEWIKRSFTFRATSASTPLRFTAAYTPGNDYLGLDNVQVRAIQPPTGTPGSGAVAPTTGLRIASNPIAAGGKQSVQVVTGKSAPLTLVLDYPDGTQVALSTHAGPDGHYAYAWSLPASVHGIVHVLVDGAGSIAQGSFAAN